MTASAFGWKFGFLGVRSYVSAASRIDSPRSDARARPPKPPPRRAKSCRRVSITLSPSVNVREFVGTQEHVTQIRQRSLLRVGALVSRLLAFQEIVQLRP